MSSPDYRILIAATQDPALIIGDLPVGYLSYTRGMNGASGADIAIPMKRMDINHPYLSQTYIRGAKTCAYVLRDGIPVFGGIVWRLRANSRERRVRLGVQGFWSYFDRRRLTVDKTYAAEDQLDIARDLISWAQAQPNGDLYLTMDTAVSGVTRDRTYSGTELGTISTIIANLAALQNGFLFRIEHSWAGNFIDNKWVPIYPLTGQQTDAVIDFGSNMVDYQWVEEVDDMATKIHVVGGTLTDGTVSTASVERASLYADGYPLMEQIFMRRDVTSTTRLTEWGNADLDRRGRAVPTPKFTVAPGPNAWPTSFDAGDQIFVHIDDGYVQVNEWHRVNGVTVIWDGGDGIEQIDVTAVPTSVAASMEQLPQEWTDSSRDTSSGIDLGDYALDVGGTYDEPVVFPYLPADYEGGGTPPPVGGGSSDLYLTKGISGALVTTEWIPIYIPFAGTIATIRGDLETASSTTDVVIRLTNLVTNYDTTIAQGDLNGFTSPAIAVGGASTWYVKLLQADNSARNLTITLKVTPA